MTRWARAVMTGIGRYQQGDHLLWASMLACAIIFTPCARSSHTQHRTWTTVNAATSFMEWHGVRPIFLQWGDGLNPLGCGGEWWHLDGFQGKTLSYLCLKSHVFSSNIDDFVDIWNNVPQILTTRVYKIFQINLFMLSNSISSSYLKHPEFIYLFEPTFGLSLAVIKPCLLKYYASIKDNYLFLSYYQLLYELLLNMHLYLDYLWKIEQSCIIFLNFRWNMISENGTNMNIIDERRRK